MQEFAALALAAGAQVADALAAPLRSINPRFLIGTGKLGELKQLAASAAADVILVDHPLSPAQERNLEKELGRRVVDRAGLILDIFAQRARSFEGKLQVELAQLQHLSTRLVRGWSHLERQKGGIGLRGPGETQLETDRRLVRDRIARLKEALRAVEKERETQRHRRRREFRVALVGYTNAGKSTLFNALTRSDVFVENRLFATLDSTTRQMVSPERQVVLVTDTVGFIRKLPHHLVASFHSTLVEAIEADVLLHVTDAADPDFRRHLTAVDVVLDKILDEPRPPRIMVFNKCDRFAPDDAAVLRVEFPDCHVVSAATGEGLGELRAELFRRAGERRAARAG